MDSFGDRPKKLHGPSDVRGGPPDDNSGDDEYLDSDEPKSDEMPGVYSDIKTKRTIYNELELPESAPGERRRATVDRSAKFAQFSEEWLDQRHMLDAEGERGLLPADQLFVPDELEGRSPFEVLGVPEGDFAEAHKSYRMLMRTLHPDVVNMAINSAIDRSMGGSDVAWKQFIELSKVFSEWYEKKPKVLKDEDLSALSGDERQKYVDAYKTWENEKPSEGSIETVRQEIRASAEKKSRVLNAAWEQIKKGLSFENIVGAAAHWETSHGSSYDDNFFLHPHQTVRLEADAEIYRDFDFTVTDDGELIFERAEPTYLSFASGFDKHIGIYEGFRENYRLKHLFAFLEHRDGRTIHHALLSDIAEEFELTGFQIGTLQNLLKANVDAEKICEELGVVPQFDLPDQYGPDAILVENIIEDVVAGGTTLNSARIAQLTKAGYAPETLTALTSFVTSEKPRAEQTIRNDSNRVTYSVAKSVRESFAQTRKREELKSSTESREYSPQKYVASKIRARLFELQKRPHEFVKTIEDIRKGPIYTTYEDATVGFRVGVEFGRDGLRLVLPVQEALNRYDYSSVTEVFFNQNDLGIMKEIAYGRSVTGTPSKTIVGKH